jgi:hypothetical protein
MSFWGRHAFGVRFKACDYGIALGDLGPTRNKYQFYSYIQWIHGRKTTKIAAVVNSWRTPDRGDETIPADSA